MTSFTATGNGSAGTAENWDQAFYQGLISGGSGGPFLGGTAVWGQSASVYNAEGNYWYLPYSHDTPANNLSWYVSGSNVAQFFRSNHRVASAGSSVTANVPGQSTITFPGSGTGVTSTPTRTTQSRVLGGMTSVEMQYSVPSGGYLKIEW